MSLSDNAVCAVLLCSYLGLGKDEACKPLSPGEWNAFLEKLMEKGLQPKDILGQDKDWTCELSLSPEEEGRIRTLCARGAALAFELEDLNNRGIQVTTVFDSAYPVLLKRKLKKKASPVLFYAGDLSLANKVGIAVAGSRNVDQEGLEFTKILARKAALEKLVVYTGGARGVDTAAETAALENGGVAVDYIADALTSRIRKRDTLNSIMDGRLLLVSDVKPDAGFSAARAMNRNRYIYASGYGSFIVSSDYNKGGTWSGATEALRNGWSKVLVWNHPSYEGNQKLIQRGAISYDLTERRLYDVITEKEDSYRQMDLFGTEEKP